MTRRTRAKLRRFARDAKESFRNSLDQPVRRAIGQERMKRLNDDVANAVTRGYELGFSDGESVGFDRGVDSSRTDFVVR